MTGDSSFAYRAAPWPDSWVISECPETAHGWDVLCVLCGLEGHCTPLDRPASLGRKHICASVDDSNEAVA